MLQKSSKYTLVQKDLIRRYLTWCYKTTKEDFDRIDRYFTQLDVDSYVLKQLRLSKDYKQKDKQQSYGALVDEFEEYSEKKKANVLKKKYSSKDCSQFHPQYIYLKNRLGAIEKAIVHFLGKKDKENIRCLYEKEMTRRILQATDH